MVCIPAGAVRVVEVLNKEVSAQDLNKGRDDDLLLDAWSNSNAILVSVRIAAGRAGEGGHFLLDWSVACVDDLGTAHTRA